MTSPATAVSQIVSDAVSAANGGWKAPEFWASAGALSASIAAVAWPGVAVEVKAVVAGVGALVVALYTLAAHATRRKVAVAALTAHASTAPAQAWTASGTAGSAGAQVTQSPAAPSG